MYVCMYESTRSQQRNPKQNPPTMSFLWNAASLLCESAHGASSSWHLLLCYGSDGAQPAEPASLLREPPQVSRRPPSNAARRVGL